MRISFSWSTRRQGNDGYVLEAASDGRAREFGPMPPHIVPAFVEARRRLMAIRATELGFDPIEQDYSYLFDVMTPHKNRQH